jgi:hypothetical protein
MLYEATMLCGALPVSHSSGTSTALDEPVIEVPDTVEKKSRESPIQRVKMRQFQQVLRKARLANVVENTNCKTWKSSNLVADCAAAKFQSSSILADELQTMNSIALSDDEVKDDSTDDVPDDELLLDALNGKSSEIPMAKVPRLFRSRSLQSPKPKGQQKNKAHDWFKTNLLRRPSSLTEHTRPYEF